MFKLERNFIPDKIGGRLNIKISNFVHVSSINISIEFRSHRHFILPSLLKKNEDFREGALPYKDFMFKNEKIYLKKDIVVLRTTEHWRRMGRKIKKGENFLKKVKGNYNDKTKMAKLYGSWQTESFENVINPDGTLPENDYGNLEIFRPQDIPKG